MELVKLITCAYIVLNYSCAKGCDAEKMKTCPTYIPSDPRKVTSYNSFDRYKKLRGVEGVDED